MKDRVLATLILLVIFLLGCIGVYTATTCGDSPRIKTFWFFITFISGGGLFEGVREAFRWSRRPIDGKA